MKETDMTAYALNELQGDERDKFESDLASDQDLQRALESASRVADGLVQVMSEPGEGLEPQEREKLLRAIAENQQAFRQRRKIVRLAVPASLAAAASIAVLLWVTGGKTTQGPAMAAADGAVSTDLSGDSAEPMGSFRVAGIRTIDPAGAAGRTINVSESGRAAMEMRADAGLSLTSPAVRMRPLIWDDELPRWSGWNQGQP